MTDATPTTHHIGAVAERTGLSLRSLRHWEEVGLITPSARTEGGFRLYTEDDIDRILLVRRMKPLGYTLEEMGDLLTLSETMADGADAAAIGQLESLLEDAEARREKLSERLAMADEFISILQRRRRDVTAR
ncbi:MerR family transcriptional regulator [Demequina sp. NBRC 110055]|uniref:MerR family transcriptional regulator n=1 Tax=Demequina sp. NBRC 110055 TaxID=1570344 RepID=UPI0009FFE23F|nr:MerR family transcriptional regulator [Demequina sp. NBRC 110055]